MSHSHYFTRAQLDRLGQVPVERWPRDFVVGVLTESTRYVEAMSLDDALGVTDPRLALCYRGHDGLYLSHWDDVSSMVRAVPEKVPARDDVSSVLALRESLVNLLHHGTQPTYNGRPSCPFCHNFVDAEETHSPGCVLVAALEEK